MKPPKPLNKVEETKINLEQSHMMTLTGIHLPSKAKLTVVYHQQHQKDQVHTVEGGKPVRHTLAEQSLQKEKRMKKNSHLQKLLNEEGLTAAAEIANIQVMEDQGHYQEVQGKVFRLKDQEDQVIVDALVCIQDHKARRRVEVVNLQLSKCSKKKAKFGMMMNSL